jgi:2,4-dienoyl-CoA reductase-like NADH-dependent reductase (Old Yellow Enzyme family)/thioredoxin reductase
LALFPHLFAPITMGPLKAANRLLMSAMSINFGVDEKGYVTPQLRDYFLARARGGVGLMLVGGGGIHPDGVELPYLPVLWEDGCIPALKQLTAAVADYSLPFGMQLMHGGRQAYHDHTVAPSPIPAPALVKSLPRELAIHEIHDIAVAFGEAARRCREGGFDFIELHGAHGYLINQFLSPNANRRRDRYGGSYENRIRFLLEVMAEVQARAGKDFPVGVRINGEDYIENGWTLADAQRLAPTIEAAGAAYLHVSAGVYGSTQLTIPSMYVPQGCFVHLAEAIKPLVKIPVITTGRIKNPQLAETILARGQADLVAMGRSLLADPELPNKARRGRLDTIRPCVGCCVACIQAVFNLEPASCVVNPDVGREYLLKTPPSSAPPKRVLVVGGGPAGMAAARLAARQGHRVTLCEQDTFLGGAARLAALPPGRGDIADFLQCQQRELGRLGVEIRLNTALSPELLAQVDPQAVVLASGALTQVPLIKGLLTTSLPVHTAEDIMAGREASGPRVLVLGGNQIGLLVADHLAAGGREVTVLQRGAHFAEEMSGNDRYYLRESLKAHGVILHKKATVREVTDQGVVCRVDGRTRVLDDCDGIVIADPRTPVRDAITVLKGRRVEVHVIGDAKSPRTLQFAVSEGEEAGRSL